MTRIAIITNEVPRTLDLDGVKYIPISDVPGAISGERFDFILIDVGLTPEFSPNQLSMIQSRVIDTRKLLHFHLKGDVEE